MAYEIHSCWVPASKYSLKCPYAMTPVGIVAHNTAGSSSAKNEAESMVNNNSATSYHVVIDENSAYECIPFNRNAWHAGDGGSGFANRNLIGIEIARSMDYSDDKFDRAEENAIEYIAWVCIQYGWNSNQINQHNWYSGTDCPHRTKFHWQSFLDRIDAKSAELTKDSNATNSGVKGEEEMTKEQVQAMIDAAHPKYNTLDELPFGRDTIQKLLDRGLMVGEGEGKLGLTYDALRILVINDRAGLYDHTAV